MERWHARVGEGAASVAGSELTVVPGAIYATITGVGLVKFNASDGTQAWHVPLDDPSGFAIAAVNQGLLYAGHLLRRQIFALHTATGKLRWSYNVAGLIVTLAFE
jgi:outer membrane protein assembly factor BamB